MEDLRAELEDYFHISRLIFYHNHGMNRAVIMSDLMQSETGMVVHRLRKHVENGVGIYVEVRWKMLPESGNTLEPIKTFVKMFQVY